MHIDLNADLGEGGSNDQELLAIVSSANISCGHHAGDETSIRAALQGALNHGVVIGAHPGYPDRENFGRAPMKLSNAQLQKAIYSQLDSLQRLCGMHGTFIRHVKPHGALYNLAAKDPEFATSLVRIIRDFDSGLIIVGLAGGELLRAATALNMAYRSEAFIDRGYAADGSLLPRSDPHAMIQDPAQAIRQALEIAMQGSVTTVDASRIKLRADTLCIHGDAVQALNLARAVRQALENNGIHISAEPANHV